MIPKCFSDTIHRWLGWCPDTGTLRTAPVICAAAPAPLASTVPDDGKKGSGRIGRGFGLALSGMGILLRNLQLLWFPFLAGLAGFIGFLVVGAIGFMSIQAGLETGPSQILGYLWLFVMVFAARIILMFCISVMLAGLVLYVSMRFYGKEISIREGLSRTRIHLKSLICWAVILAVPGTVAALIMNYVNDINVLFLIVTAACFVFYTALMFGVPVIILENKGPLDAAIESVRLARKLRLEIVGFAIIFCLILFAVSLTAMDPGYSMGYPSGMGMIPGAALYNAFAFSLSALSALAAVVASAVLGILLTGLYAYGKTGRVPEEFLETERRRQCP